MKRTDYRSFSSFCPVWMRSCFSRPPSFKVNDIPRVMERFFSFHIENKELSPTIVRRSLKLYIEQFDPEKSYLLESGGLPYFNLSDPRQRDFSRLEANDYSDFIALNQIIQKLLSELRLSRNDRSKILVLKDELGISRFRIPISISPSEKRS